MFPRSKYLGEYRIGKTIGEGAFSKVKLAEHRITKEQVAIKVIKKATAEDDESKEEAEPKKGGTPTSSGNVSSITLARRGSNASQKGEVSKATPEAAALIQLLSKEVKLLMRLSHPNIIRLHQVLETSSEIMIVMDYASGGEMIDYIAAKGHLQEREARRFYRQLVSALQHCHAAGVVHRDLKLENILLDKNKDLRLSDFGLGRTMRGGGHYLNTFCGTPLYASPELVSNIEYIGPPADVWSSAVVLYLMCAGQPPFYGKTIAELYRAIKNVRYACPDHFSDDLRMLLSKLLVQDPSQRATMDDLYSDAWLIYQEAEPILRFPPKSDVESIPVDPRAEDEQIARMIGTISFKEGCIVYNIDTNPSAPRKTTPKSVNFEDESDDSVLPLPSISTSSKGSQSCSNDSSTIGGSDNSFQNGDSLSDEAISTVPNRQRRHSVAVAPRPAAPKPAVVAPASVTVASKQPAPFAASALIDDAVATLAANRARRYSVGAPAAVAAHAAMQQAKAATKAATNEPVRRASVSTTRDEIIEQRTGRSPAPANPPLTALFSGKVPDVSQIRTQRFAIIGDSKTTKLSPIELLRKLETICKEHRIIVCLGHSPWIFQCRIQAEGNAMNGSSSLREPVMMELEVCKAWLLNVYGIRMKRVSGNALAYKQVYERICLALNA